MDTKTSMTQLLSVQIVYNTTDFKNNFALAYTSRLVMEIAKSVLARELDTKEI
jgi:hypothetical protein